jgi:hypothetical protein
MHLRPALFLIAIAFCSLSGSAQTEDARTHNRHLFDSFQRCIDTGWCGREGLMPAGSYPARKTRKLQEFLRVLNNIYAEGVSEEDILKKLKKFQLGRNLSRYWVDSTQMGIMQAVTCLVRVADYLGVAIRLTCLDGQVLARRFELNPSTTRWCVNRTMKFYDMDYLSKVYAPILNFPLRNMPFEYLYATRLSPETIRRMAAAYPDYRFTLPDDSSSAAPGNMLTAQYFLTQWDHLTDGRPGEEFLNLVRGGDVGMLTTLLYSPNYYYAVSAMLSLNYLKSVGKVEFTADISKEIDRVKKAHFLILYQHSDVEREFSGYSEIKGSDDWFIRQYRLALERKTTPSSGF